MSVPLDRLYYWLDDQIPDDVLIYRWYPHGSKKIEDLSPLTPYHGELSWLQYMTRPMVICHDQEPLNFDSYQLQCSQHLDKLPDQSHIDLLRQLPPLRFHCNYLNVNDKMLLVHSEQNSKDVKKFIDHNFIDVFYWSHAVISLDWFRYAKVDQQLQYKTSHFRKDFLVYNRAWSGTREYRLKFCELLIQQDLVQNCNVKFAEYDDNIHYSCHEWTNQKLKINMNNIHEYIQPNTTDAKASADYVSDDYQASAIEVVLETLFDDTRIHHTEKTLRPIACGKPFILVSTPGSLKYLRSYGFETFNGLIDETYDCILDPALRLQHIIIEMHRIAKLPHKDKIILFAQLHQIAERNKQRFFSSDFIDHVANEFVNNIDFALIESVKHKTNKWRKLLRPIWLDIMLNNLPLNLNNRFDTLAVKDLPPLEDIMQVDKELYQDILKFIAQN